MKAFCCTRKHQKTPHRVRHSYFSYRHYLGFLTSYECCLRSPIQLDIIRIRTCGQSFQSFCSVPQMPGESRCSEEPHRLLALLNCRFRTVARQWQGVASAKPYFPRAEACRGCWMPGPNEVLACPRISFKQVP